MGAWGRLYAAVYDRVTERLDRKGAAEHRELVAQGTAVPHRGRRHGPV